MFLIVFRRSWRVIQTRFCLGQNDSNWHVLKELSAAMCLRCAGDVCNFWDLFLKSSWFIVGLFRRKFESGRHGSLRAGGGATLGHWVQHGKDQGWVPLSTDKKADGERRRLDSVRWLELTRMEDRLDNYRRFGNYDLETTLWELRLGN